MRRSIQEQTGLDSSARNHWIRRSIEEIWQDCRLAVRTLSVTPIVSFIATLSLALAIGANTTIFSLVNALLLRPLPVKNPHELVLVSDPAGQPSYAWSYAVWDQIRQRPHLFDGTLAFFATRFNLSTIGEADFVDGICVSGGFFKVLGVDAAYGRALTEADDQPYGNASLGRVAMISHAFWLRRFGGATDALGRTVSVDRVPFTIVGVLPRGFAGPVVGRAADVVIPVASVPRQGMLKNSGLSWLVIMARLKPGQTADVAAVSLRAEQAQIREGARLPPGPVSDLRMRQPLTLVSASGGNPFAPLRRRYEQPFLTMQILVTIVLLIACANISNLMLARSDGRRHEMSARLALGASRWQLTRLFLIESLVLAGIGALGGVLFARWAGRFLVPLLSGQNNPAFLDLTLDAPVLIFTAGIAIVSALVFGTVPALRASRVDAIEALKEQGRSVARSRAGLAEGVIIVQVALSLVLLMGAGLFVRSFTNLSTLNVGFEPNGVLIVSLDRPVERSTRPTSFEEVRQAVARLPGVTGAAMAMMTPISGAAIDMPVEVEGAPALPAGQNHISGNAVSPGWFSVYGISILAGRDFTDADVPGSRPVTIANQAFARRFLNGANPVGRIVRQAEAPPGRPPLTWEIIGMVEDTAYESIRSPLPPMLYSTFAQFDEVLQPSVASLSLRSATAPMVLRRSVVDAVSKVNPDLVLSFRSLREVVSSSIQQEETLAMVVGFFGALALLLSALGIYGVASFSVTRRREELGIRMALGASPRGIVGLVLSRITLLIGAGVVIGAAVSVWLAHLVAPLLYGLQASDPITLAAAGFILIAVGIVAGAFPAHRASRIAPR